ncbi:hypothetical protein HOY80DRAFT_1141683 [Tuber brumale]|nr:hypothetical protein HOY80DRAFT_1141683 [Tuber brumale]
MSLAKYLSIAILALVAGAQAQSPPNDAQPGQPADCNKWYYVVPGDTCQGIVDKYPGLTLNQFLSWNTGAGPDCTTLWAFSSACIGVSSGTTPTPTITPITTTPVPTGGVSKPSPVQDGQPSDCNGWYLAKSSDTCNSISGIYGLTFADFVAMNPAIGTECKNLRPGYYVCIAHSCPTPPTPTTMMTSGLPAKYQDPTPSPTESGSPSNCNK